MTVRVYSPRSQCEGKRPFISKRDAKRVARHAESHGLGRAQVYRCPHCGDFHIGHKPHHVKGD